MVGLGLEHLESFEFVRVTLQSFDIHRRLRPLEYLEPSYWLSASCGGAALEANVIVVLPLLVLLLISLTQNLLF